MINGINQQMQIGSHGVKRIGYDWIQSGDIVCTYETLNTRPDLLAIEAFQRSISLRSRPQLSKMFHFEVILNTYPRKGMCRIAHADGKLRKVTIQNENFKDHHPGQALLVFRAKSEAIRKEIAAVAEKIAQIGNGHACRIHPVSTFGVSHLPLLLKVFKFENFQSKPSEETLRELARLMVDYEEKGRFCEQDGVSPKSMSCVEYAANVVNVAVMRQIFRGNSSLASMNRTAKIEAIFRAMQAESRFIDRDSLPLKFSCLEASPASLVDFFFRHPRYFETVGYMGYIDDKMEGPVLDIEGKPAPIFLQAIESLFPKSSRLALYAVQFMEALGMCGGYGQMHPQASVNSKVVWGYPKALRDSNKIKALFCGLYAKGRGMDFREAAEKLKDAESGIRRDSRMLEGFRRFSERMMTWTQTPSKQFGNFSDSLGLASNSNNLPIEEKMELLILEKDFIKASSLKNTEKTLKMSMNCLAQEKLRIERIGSIARRIHQTGRAMLSWLFLAPLYPISSLASCLLERIAAVKNRRYCTLKHDILAAHERIRKNCRIGLKSPWKGDGRPWLHYSIDAGKTWDLEPFERDGASWSVSIRVPDRSCFVHKTLAGPEDANDPDPILTPYATSIPSA